MAEGGVSGFDPMPLKFTPGVVRDRTRRANEMGWWDCDKVRFVQGLPQTIGGWSKPFESAVIGAPRALFGWVDLNGFQLMGIGTHVKYYVEEGGGLTDITPIRRTVTLGANPIATSNGSGIVTITDAAHGAMAGEFVTISGATAFNNLTTDELNQEFEIITVTTNTYTVDTGGSANASSSGGGAAVEAEYQITAGLETAVAGGGYGAGAWGRGGWSSAAVITVQGAQLRVWTQDNWGEDLLINPRGYPIFYYDRSNPSDRALDLNDLPGASDAPVIADQVIVASEQRHVLAFGCNELGGTDADPMIWRWADQESVVDWTPSASTAAGGNRFLIGSRFMQAIKTRQEILAFTDRALYSVQYVGVPDIFTQRLISPNVAIASPRGAGFFGDTVYWMEARGFKLYNGQVRDMPCPLSEYVFRDINLFQLWKCHCAVNQLYSEIWWFYCSADSEEIDRYIMVNVNDGTWVNGTLARTAWLPNNVFTLPRASDPDGYIYDQETGYDDGSTSPTTPLQAFAESSPFLIGHGSRAVRIKSVWPDLDFLDSIAVAPEATLVLKLQDKFGTQTHATTNSDVIRTVATPIEVFTDRVDIGKRARMVAFRIESNTIGTQWRLGTPHIELRPDGRR